MTSSFPKITPLTIEAQNYLYMENTSNADTLATITTSDSLLCAVELAKYPTSTTASYNSTTQTCTINNFSPFPQYTRNNECTLLMKVANVVDTLVNNWTKKSSTTFVPQTYTDLYCSPELANVSYGRGLCANTAGCSGYRQYTDSSTATDYGCLVTSNTATAQTTAGTFDQSVFTGNRGRVMPLNVTFTDVNLAVFDDPDTLETLQISSALQNDISSNYSSKGDPSVLNTFVLGTFILPTKALCATSIALSYNLPFNVDGYTTLITTTTDVQTTTTVAATGGIGSSIINPILFGKNNNGKVLIPINTVLYVILIANKFAQPNTLPTTFGGGSIAARYYLRPDADAPISPEVPILSALPTGNLILRQMTTSNITLTLSSDFANNTITLPINYVGCVGAYINVSTSNNNSLISLQLNAQSVFSSNIAGNVTFANLPTTTLNSILYAGASLSASFPNDSNRQGTCTLIFFINV